MKNCMYSLTNSIRLFMNISATFNIPFFIVFIAADSQEINTPYLLSKL